MAVRALTTAIAVLGALTASAAPAVSAQQQVRPVVFGVPLPADPADNPPDDNAPTPALLTEKLHEYFDQKYSNLYSLVTWPCPGNVRRACEAPAGDIFDFISKRDQVRALGPVSFTVTDVVPADLPTKAGVDTNVNITGPPSVAGISHPCEFRLENNSWKIKYTDLYDLLSIMSNAANAH